jgi:hypothetical protein
MPIGSCATKLRACEVKKLEANHLRAGRAVFGRVAVDGTRRKRIILTDQPGLEETVRAALFQLCCNFVTQIDSDVMPCDI